MIRRLLIGLLALVVVLVVAADRVGASVAAHVLAGKLQTDEHLTSRPSVTIGGFPFLTQAFHGKYSDVKVTADDYTTTDHVPIDTLTADLHGVHIPLSKVISGSVSTVDVDRVDGSAFVSFADITSYLTGTGVSVTLQRAGPDTVSVVGRLLGHHSKLLRGVATVAVRHEVVTLSLALNGASAGSRVLSIPLRALPFRFNVTSVSVGIGGITGTGTANGVVLGS